jgi:tetratricopeptide (TPR) repeat protein
MKFLRWIGAQSGIGGVNSLNRMRQLVLEAHPHLRAEEYDKARAVFLEALKFRARVNDSATIHSLLTSLEATWPFTQKYDDAIAFFAEYVRVYSGDSAAYAARADALWYSGRLHETLDDYCRAVELNPGDPLSLSGRGQVLAEIGESERAMEDLHRALLELSSATTSSPEWAAWYKSLEAFVRNGRGFALAAFGDSGSAMDEFELSIALCPENAWVYHNRAQVYDRAGSKDKAFADYRTALEQNGPALTPIKKRYAQARVLELSDHL